MKKLSKLLGLALLTITLLSSNGLTNQAKCQSHATAYEMMSTVFVGKPKISKIKPLMEAVMKKYKLPNTELNRKKVASMLVALREKSAVGVTEMEILKRMYQKGDPNIKITKQAAISFTILEHTK